MHNSDCKAALRALACPCGTKLWYRYTQSEAGALPEQLYMRPCSICKVHKVIARRHCARLHAHAALSSGLEFVGRESRRRLSRL